MSEVERLRAYHPFDNDVLERVSEVALAQKRLSWEAIAGNLPTIQIFQPENGKPIEVLDIFPKDYESTQVYHLPLNSTIDPNMSIRVATLATAQPETRIIAVGNPGAPGLGEGKIRARDLKGVYRGDNLRPLVDPVLQYLASKGVETSTQIGYGYGADKAAVACHFAENYGQKVCRGVFMEPIGVIDRNLNLLASQIYSARPAVKRYVDAAQSSPYNRARFLADKLGQGNLGYALGLLKLSNIAIYNALTYAEFWWNLNNALTRQKDMQISVQWGTKSEVVPHNVMTEKTYTLARIHGSRRIHTTMLEDQKHAMSEDIFLHTAMVLQGTK